MSILTGLVRRVSKGAKGREAEAEVEIRKVLDVEDFGESFTPNPEVAKVKIK